MSNPFALNYRFDFDPGYDDPEPHFDDQLDDLIYDRYDRLHDRLVDEEMEYEFRSPFCFDDYDDGFERELEDLLEGPPEVELPPRIARKLLQDRRPKQRNRLYCFRDWHIQTSWKHWRRTRYWRIAVA
jgi:hypothetical protein